MKQDIDYFEHLTVGQNSLFDETSPFHLRENTIYNRPFSIITYKKEITKADVIYIKNYYNTIMAAYHKHTHREVSERIYGDEIKRIQEFLNIHK